MKNPRMVGNKEFEAAVDRKGRPIATREQAWARLLELVGAEDRHRGPALKTELKDAMLRLRATLANEPQLVVGLMPGGYVVWPSPPPQEPDKVIEAPLEPEDSVLVREEVYRDAKTGKLLSKAVAGTLPPETWVKETITRRKAKPHGQEG